MTTRINFLAFAGAGAMSTLLAQPAMAAGDDGGGTLVALYKKPAEPAAFKNFAQAGVDVITFPSHPA